LAGVFTAEDAEERREFILDFGIRILDLFPSWLCVFVVKNFLGVFGGLAVDGLLHGHNLEKLAGI
jgi:hypothetical protein